jgi:hypothetical protein
VLRARQQLHTNQQLRIAAHTTAVLLLLLGGGGKLVGAMQKGLV